MLSVLTTIMGSVVLDSCSGNGNDMVANKYVVACTEGQISRFSEPMLILSQEVNYNGDLNDVCEIEPSVKGTFRLQDKHTIVFDPETELARATEYTVTTNLRKIFDDKEVDKFSYSFRTITPAMRAKLTNLECDAKNDNIYTCEFSILTSEPEKSLEVENAVLLSEEGVTTKWSHTSDGRSHKLTIGNVLSRDTDHDLALAIGNNQLGIEKGALLNVSIPSKTTFDVYSVIYNQAPEKYIEVTFTKNLGKQNMIGLAKIKENVQSKAVDVHGNKMKLYPDVSDNYTTLHVEISADVMSASGIRLGKNISKEVEIKQLKPEVSFVDNNVVVPLSDHVIIPFKATYLRGVTVRVLKVFENNMGIFLQTGDLNEYSNMRCLARPVCRKTIFLDEDPSNNLTECGTYALDLKELIEMEPGAIYRVELSFDQRLSAWPNPDYKAPSKAEIIADDEREFLKECKRFNNYSSWYSTGSTMRDGYSSWYDEFDSWDEYNKASKDPANEAFYTRDNVVGRNVLATNIGLAALGNNEEVTVFTNNLVTARPEKGVTVNFYNLQNQQIASIESNSDGVAIYKSENGQVPFYIVAQKGKEKCYLKLGENNSLSMSAFDVSGASTQDGVNGFIYCERGVRRPGDTLHLGFMFVDKANLFPEGHPVVLILKNPSGKQYARQVSNRSAGIKGLYKFTLPIAEDAPTGMWNAKIQLGGATFEKSIRVETIKPNRLKIDMKLPAILTKSAASAMLSSEWLHGGKAGSLNYDVTANFRTTSNTFKGYEKYSFNANSDYLNEQDIAVAKGKLNASGQAVVPINTSKLGNATSMIKCEFVTKVFEPSGEFSTDVVTTKYSPYTSFVGVAAPETEAYYLPTGHKHKIGIVTVTPEGKPCANHSIEFSIVKVDWYWWYESDDRNVANYIANRGLKPIVKKTVVTDASGQASVDFSPTDSEWGTYAFVAHDRESNHVALTTAYFDYMEGRSTEQNGNSTTFKFAVDKSTYKPGDKMKVVVPSSKECRAIISVCNSSGVLFTKNYECKDGETSIDIEITPEMQPNAYLCATVLQPHGNTLNDVPIRIYGVRNVMVNDPESVLVPEVKMDDELIPDGDFTVKVTEKNGKEMAYTLAIVDEGLLDLTHFKTPDPWKHFNAREAMSMRMWDMYSHVAGAFGGRFEQVFSIGGDDENSNAPKSIVNRFTPVVKMEGPFLLKKGKSVTHNLHMPNYNGRVRVMVVATDGEKAFGSSEKSVLVRKPVMLLGTLPRTIGVGEEMDVPVSVFASKDGIGNIAVSLKTDDKLTIVGPNQKTVNLPTQGDKTVTFRVKVNDKAGLGRVSIDAKAGRHTADYTTDITIRSISEPQINFYSGTIPAGKSWSQNINLVGIDGTNMLDVDLSTVKPINLARRLKDLVGYPHGCVEQITSKAFPQLFMGDYTQLDETQKADAADAVKQTIERLKLYQAAGGGFSYWPGGKYVTSYWASTYASHFLVEAEKKGFVVPTSLRNDAISFLKSKAKGWKSNDASYSYNSVDQAYRLYVLALAGQAELGAMNRLKEAKSVLNEQACWLLAAAYAQSGHTEVANQLVAAAPNAGNDDYYSYCFSSPLRTAAIKLLATVHQNKQSQATELYEQIADELNSDKWLSTQSAAFALVAASKYNQKYLVDGKIVADVKAGTMSKQVNTNKVMWTDNFVKDAATGSKQVTVKNNGSSTVFVKVSTEGVAKPGEIAPCAYGLDLKVNYVDENNSPINISALNKGKNFKAVVVVRNTGSKKVQNLAVSQIFPSGWEILNTRYNDETIANDQNTYRDFRDDRVYSYIDDLGAGSSKTFVVNLCATYSGHFYLPAVKVEAMYDKSIRANTASSYVDVR